MATEVAGRWFLFNPVWKGFHSHPALILWILFTGSIWLAPVPVVEKPVKDTKMRSVWPFDDPGHEMDSATRTEFDLGFASSVRSIYLQKESTTGSIFLPTTPKKHPAHHQPQQDTPDPEFFHFVFGGVKKEYLPTP